MTQLRGYQEGAVQAVLDYWRGGGGNPLVDMATGTGKSIVIGTLMKRLLEDFPSLRVLALVHVRELVSQNYMALKRMWPDAPAGIYSAGLGKRDAHSRIVFASIQSVYRKARELGARNLVLVDEAHLVPNGGDGMYRSLLDELADADPDMRLAGFSATPYRMDSGRLDEGDGHLFDEVVFSYGIRQGIADGYLSPLISKGGATEIDVSGVAKRGGEFVAGALEAAADDADVTRAAVAEIRTLGADRRSILAFCTGVKHAHHVAEEFRAQGVTCATVTGDTPTGERDSILMNFKAGRIRALTNANVLTTGFDAPGCDLIAMLRPTLSTGLYVQMIGRGTRLAEGKSNCLVLDYAGVVRRHGPVDTVEVVGKRRGAMTEAAETKVAVDTVRAKTCPVCSSIAPLGARECADCGHLWPEPEPVHERTADDVPILSDGIPKTVNEWPVLAWQASRWVKDGSPDTVRVTYMAGLQAVSEWVCPEHPKFARDKFEKWWRQHSAEAPPDTVDEVLRAFGDLRRPTIIITKPNGRYADVVGRRFSSVEEEAA